MNSDAVVEARKDQLGQLRCVALTCEMFNLNAGTFKDLHDPQLDKAFSAWLGSMSRHDFEKVRTRQPKDFNIDDVAGALVESMTVSKCAGNHQCEIKFAGRPPGVFSYSDEDLRNAARNFDQELRELTARIHARNIAAGKIDHNGNFRCTPVRVPEEPIMTSKPNFKPGDVVVADDVYKGTLIVEYQGTWLVDAQHGEVRKVAPDAILMWKQEIEDAAKRIDKALNGERNWHGLTREYKERCYRAAFAALDQLIGGGKDQ